MARAVRAGGRVATPVRGVPWEYCGYFTDLDDCLWRVVSDH